MSRQRKTIRSLMEHEKEIICPLILQRQSLLRELRKVETSLAGMVLIAAGADHQGALLDMELLELYEEVDATDCTNMVIVDHAESQVPGKEWIDRENSPADAKEHTGSA